MRYDQPIILWFPSGELIEFFTEIGRRAIARSLPSRSMPIAVIRLS